MVVVLIVLYCSRICFLGPHAFAWAIVPHVLMFTVIYRLFDDRSCFKIESTWLLSAHPPTPAHSTPSTILSFILLPWVMAFVIPNDSRNKSTVMRSHYVPFFPFPFAEITLHSSVQSTCFSNSDWALHLSSSEPAWNKLPPEDLPAAKMDTLLSWACLFTPLPISTNYFLTH